MGRLFRLTVLLAGVLAAGCGPVGPEVRLSPDALSWRPASVAMLPAIASGNVVPSGGTLPAGEVRPTAGDALNIVSSALAGSFRDRSEVKVVPLLFSSTQAGMRAETASRQYLDARAVDPLVAVRLGTDTGSDAILLTAVLRYGPEVEDIQQVNQNANTKLGTNQVNISSTASRAVLYYNIQYRCALVRCADGAILWDASIRKREKHLAILNVTQDSVLRSAIGEVVDTFPYARPRPEPIGGGPGGK